MCAFIYLLTPFGIVKLGTRVFTVFMLVKTERGAGYADSHKVATPQRIPPLYQIFCSKWDHDLQNGHHAVLKKTSD